MQSPQSSQPPCIHICIISSLFSLLAALVLHLLLLLLGHQHLLCYIFFDTLHLISGINFLFIFIELISVSVAVSCFCHIVRFWFQAAD